MEKLSKYSWVLIGYKSKTEDEKLTDEDLEKLTQEAFISGKVFQLYLCGAFVDKSGTLEQMEEGLDLILGKMTDYHEGDYCIVSDHENGNLLFLPIKEEKHD